MRLKLSWAVLALGVGMSGCGKMAHVSDEKPAPPPDAQTGFVLAVLNSPFEGPNAEAVTFEWPPGLTKWLETHPAKPGQCLVGGTKDASDLAWSYNCPPQPPVDGENRPHLPIPKELERQ